MLLVVVATNSTVGHSVADMIQNATTGRTQSKEIVAISNNQLMKRTTIIKPTWHAPWKLMRVCICFDQCYCVFVCVCVCTCVMYIKHEID